MFNYVKKLTLFMIVISLLLLLGFLAYFGIQDIWATRAKNYIIEKYNFGKFEVFAYKTTEYVYDENNNCGNLWFKECTYEENKYKEIVFITKNKQKFIVKEYRNGSFEDDYKSDNS